MFLGKPIPLPALGHPDETQLKIESYFVDRVVDYWRGPGRTSPRNYKYHRRLRGYGPESDLEYPANEIPGTPMPRNNRRVPNPERFAR